MRARKIAPRQHVIAPRHSRCGVGGPIWQDESKSEQILNKQQERRGWLGPAWLACVGRTAGPPSSLIERKRALRLMLRSSAKRLLETQVFKGSPMLPSQLESAARWSGGEREADSAGSSPTYCNFQRLEAQEELWLTALAKAGDRFAQQKLLIHHLPLLSIIGRRYRRAMSLSELINEGTFGLMHAIERFDPKFRVRFGTYARWWIHDAMDRAVRQQGRLMGTDREAHRPYSGPAGSEEQAFHEVDEAGPEALANEMSRSRLLERALNQLSERERQVLAGRYGLDERPPRTLHEMASETGLSHERVRQIQNSALERLKGVLGHEP
jgi:RNA polymerase nonessential primary-like sigma factor